MWENLRREAAIDALADQEAFEAVKTAEAQRTLAHNEQVKLTANVLNIVAAGFLITGIVAPLTNVGTSITPSSVINEQALAVMAIWMILAIILHCSGKLVLRNLR